MLAKALTSGGKPWKSAQDHGFMYGVSFADPDGHVWEVMWIDQTHVVDRSLGQDRSIARGTAGR